MRLSLFLLVILIYGCHRSAAPHADDSDSKAFPEDSATDTAEQNTSTEGDTGSNDDTGSDAEIPDTDTGAPVPLGPCTTTQTSTYDGGADERWSETTYSQDLSESVTVVYQTSADNHVETSTVAYDEKGNIVEARVEYLITDSIATTRYTWFDNGQMSMEHRKIENSDGVANEEMTTWNEQGMQLARMIRTGTSDGLVLLKEYQYTFDEHGNCITVESRNSADAAFEVAEKRVITYRDELLEPPSIATVEYYSEDIQVMYLREIYTEENGIRQIHYEWYDNSGSESGVIRTETDKWNAMGLPVSSETDYRADGTIETATYYEYSPEGLLLKKVHDPIDQIADDEVTDYTYDSMGNLIREYRTWDSLEGDEIIGCTSLIEYTWDCWQ